MDSSKRAFIKKSCGFCASIVGISLLSPVISSCSTLKYIEPVFSNGFLQLSISDFVENSNLVIVKNKSLEYDVAVVKIANDFYRAFELKCTHQDNALVPTNSGFHCNLHGSSFGLDGKVKTLPASSNLNEFKTSFASGIISIKLF